MLSVVLLNVIMLIVTMLSTMAPILNSGWIQTLNLRMSSQMLYDCATNPVACTIKLL
jgi:hypothetical protein